MEGAERQNYWLKMGRRSWLDRLYRGASTPPPAIRLRGAPLQEDRLLYYSITYTWNYMSIRLVIHLRWSANHAQHRSTSRIEVRSVRRTAYKCLSLRGFEAAESVLRYGRLDGSSGWVVGVLRTIRGGQLVDIPKMGIICIAMVYYGYNLLIISASFRRDSLPRSPLEIHDQPLTYIPG